MRRFRKQIIHVLVVLGTVTFVTFAMVDLLPGDAALTLQGADASAEDLESLRVELGLNANVFVRYGRWLGRAVQGDLGVSNLSGESVWDLILSRLSVTVELLLLAQIIALALAIPTAIICALRPGSPLDRWLGAAGLGTLSIPSFVMAILLIYLFSIHLGWLPATGFVPLIEGVLDNLRFLALPSLSIALVEWVPLTRVLRSDLITTLDEEFILLARSKGLNRWRVLIGHALRPSSLTLVTVVGLQMGHLIGGAVVVESIFSLPGIGRLLINAVYGRDPLVVQGCVLWITIGYLIIHLMVEALYVGMDPRIRDGAKHG